MSATVADASAVLEYLLRTTSGMRLEETIREADLHVPALCDIEVAAGLRRGMLHGTIHEGRAAEAVEDYLDLPITRHGHQALVPRILDLRSNFSAYDAAYVALAEQLDGRLLTADAALASAARSHTGIEVVSV